VPTNIDGIIAELSPAQRKKVEARAAQLIAGEMAKTLGIAQDSVSRLEKRSDLPLFTRRKTVQAISGKLSLVAEFPGRAPVVLSGIAQDDPGTKTAGRETNPRV
jgi:hypothetical protein